MTPGTINWTGAWGVIATGQCGSVALPYFFPVRWWGITHYWANNPERWNAEGAD